MNVIVIIALVIVLIFLICIIMTIAATCISINKQWSEERCSDCPLEEVSE